MEEQRTRALFERPAHLNLPPVPVHKESDLAEVLKSFVPLAQSALQAVLNKPKDESWTLEKILAIMPTMREALADLSGARNIQVMMEKSDRLVEKLIENSSRSKRDLQDVIEAIGVMRRAAQEFAPKQEGPTLADVMGGLIDKLPDIVNSFRGERRQGQIEASPYPPQFKLIIQKLKVATTKEQTKDLIAEAYQCLASDERWGPRVQAMAKQIGPNNKSELVKLFRNILIDAVAEQWIAQSDVDPILVRVVAAVDLMFS